MWDGEQPPNAELRDANKVDRAADLYREQLFKWWCPVLRIFPHDDAHECRE